MQMLFPFTILLVFKGSLALTLFSSLPNILVHTINTFYLHMLLHCNVRLILYIKSSLTLLSLQQMLNSYYVTAWLADKVGTRQPLDTLRAFYRRLSCPSSLSNNLHQKSRRVFNQWEDRCQCTYEIY